MFSETDDHTARRPLERLRAAAYLLFDLLTLEDDYDVRWDLGEATDGPPRPATEGPPQPRAGDTAHGHAPRLRSASSHERWRDGAREACGRPARRAPRQPASPERARRDPGTLGHRRQLGPRDLRVDR
jgi:hypothetical protein